MTRPLLIIFLVSPSITFSQAADSMLADKFITISDSLHESLSFDSALIYLHKSLAIYERLNSPRIVDCHNRISRCHSSMQNFEEAHRSADKVLGLIAAEPPSERQAEIQAYYNHGYAYLMEQKLEQAEQSFNKALRIPSNDNLLQGRLYRELGMTLGFKRKHSEAESYAHKAIHLFTQAVGEQSKDVAVTYNQLSLIFKSKGDYATAKKYVKKAIHTAIQAGSENQLSNAYVNLGNIHGDVAEYDSAMIFYQKSLAIRKKLYGDGALLVAAVYNNIGIVYAQIANDDKAIEYWEKAIEIRKRKGLKEDDYNLQYLYNNMGNVYFNSGKNHLAAEYYRKSIAIGENILGKDHPNLATLYAWLGRVCIALNNYQEASSCLGKAERLMKESQGENNPRLILIYQTLGEYHFAVNKMDSSILYYTRALNQVIKVHNKNYPTAGDCYIGIGKCYRKKGKFGLASEYYQKALQNYTHNFGKKNAVVSLTLNKLIELYFGEKKYDQTLHYVSQSLAANSFQPGSVEALDDNLLLETLDYKAKAHGLLFEKTGDLKALDSALVTYSLADKLISKIRSENDNQDDKLQLSETATKIYGHAIKYCLLQYEIDHNGDRLSKAFYFSEMSKAALLSSILSDLSAKKFSGIPQKILDLESQLKSDRAYCQSRIQNALLSNDGADSATVIKYRSLLFDVNRKSDSLTASIEKTFPQYYKLRYDQRSIELNALRKRLPEKTLFLEYFDGDDIIYLFAVTGKGQDVFKIQKDSVLKFAIDLLIKSIVTEERQTLPHKNYSEFTSSAQTLYNVLLKQVLNRLASEEEIGSLVVVPDGQLCYVPFDILLTKTHTGPFGNYKDLNYLAKEYSISYGYSATLTFAKNNFRLSTNNHLAFAPSYDKMKVNQSLASNLSEFRNSIIPLKWNQHEVEAISAIVSGHNYVADDATESRFKNEAPNYDIIHLAMHAFVDDSVPMNSCFVFAQGTDSIEDGYLYAFELYNMQLNAQLAVLSACNTGSGQLRKGEGIMSLARAFGYAGVPSVIMSHWQIDDEAASKIMEHFYSLLEKGMNKSEALRQSKLLYLAEASPVEAHPFYWAAFFCTGSDSPLDFGSNPRKNIMIALLTLVLGIGLFYFVKRYKQAAGS